MVPHQSVSSESPDEIIHTAEMGSLWMSVGGKRQRRRLFKWGLVCSSLARSLERSVLSWSAVLASKEDAKISGRRSFRDH